MADNLFSFFANAPPESGLNQQAMEARRRMALQVMANAGRKGYPKNLGEGLTAIGDALGERATLNRLAAQEAAYQTQATKTSAGAVPEEARTPTEEDVVDKPVSYAPTEPAAKPVSYAPPVDAAPAVAAIDRAITPPADVPPQPQPLPAPLPSALPTAPVQQPPGPAQAQQMRDLIAAKIQARGGALVPPGTPPIGGPPPNPTLPGAPPPPADGAGGGPSDQRLAFATPPGVTGIQPAPPLPSQLRQMPQPMPPPAAAPPVALPKEGPMTADEKRGWAIRSRGAAMGDANLIQQGQSLIDYGAAQRKQAYDLQLKNWEWQRGAEQRDVEIAKARQGLIAGPTAPGAPGVPSVPGGPMAGPGVPQPQQPYDMRLGTPQSPQRTGIPTAPPVPPGISPEQHATQQAPILTANAQAALKAEPQFAKALALINVIRNHPGREMGQGALGNVLGQIPNTDAYGYHQALKELQGKEFLEAYASLRGSGSIANREGETATNAMIARVNAAQNKQEFDAALNTLEKNMRTDLETAQRKVNRPVTAWRTRDDNASFAPDIGQRDAQGRIYIGGYHKDPMSWMGP